MFGIDWPVCTLARASRLGERLGNDHPDIPMLIATLYCGECDQNLQDCTEDIKRDKRMVPTFSQAEGDPPLPRAVLTRVRDDDG